MIRKIGTVAALALVLGLLGFQGIEPMNDHTIYQFTMDRIDGTPESLETYKGKVVLIVNTASECGLTPQYADLQELYTNWNEEGLVVLGFPANNFGAQEPGSNEEIQGFCTKNYGVDFPMFSKISVKGEDQHDLYKFLTQKELNGLEDSEVKWNFQKYLIGRDGHLKAVISPMKKVTEEDVLELIQAEL